MKIKSIFIVTAVVVAASASSVQAAERFATLGDVPAVKMTSAQTAEVRGANHVIRLVQFSGATLLTQAAIDATTAAGSIGGVGQDRPKIVGLLP